ncbi:hypothetical protein LZZ85_05850 [Terrimonas sp. NA20]|uniref:Uncharacterized protein n=1 Tax=Terrimonas ginsenosidimutans TaxID=2908004 RepID=A0ABS9KN85_9BACT|nr:hypothetical protein [Terrimonas ginsenosidimutans]MCG2613792.1 hypothetical protein [Terrimonas ginsenosidimutans]
MNRFSRRSFIRTSALSTIAVTSDLSGLNLFSFNNTDPLLIATQDLASQWAQTLVRLQIKDANDPNYGTMIYPPENKVHGRMGDTFYPFLHFAHRRNDQQYLDAAILLYRWMEKTVSQEDGSWLNEPVKNSWKGTTVFTSIALAEALLLHGDILDRSFREQIMARLRKSGDYVFNNFTIDYGNVNYPVAGSYCLSLLGKLLDDKNYKAKGKELAHTALKFFTKTDHFLHGEGTPYYTPSAKGCYSIDLGYNVEESLPSLALYAKLTGDKEVEEAAVKSLRTHLEFMLPDGGWDNSWGTRNYKWTWWGSRTSDGSQPALALLAHKEPAFYKAALQNTLLLKAHTKDGILYGGPHYSSHKVPASLHHTFCHLKALVTVLDNGITTQANAPAVLPREKEYGSRFFEDIQTTLVSKGKFRGTITTYDRDYKDFKGGHASGGALSLLWHEKAGIIFSASMNEYQLYESGNMQKDTDPLSMPLTPRIELKRDGIAYTNINDFTATMRSSQSNTGILIETTSKLVDKNQCSPSSGEIHCVINYRFTGEKLFIEFRHDNTDPSLQIQTILPVISASTEKVDKTRRGIVFKREEGKLQISSNRSFITLPTGTSGRIFNFVPGLEAMPLCVEDADVMIEVSVGD